MGRRRMTVLRLRYVHRFTDRHGRVRHYFRRGRFRAALPGAPGSPEFMAAYQAALEGAPAPVGASRTVPGSVSALAVAFYTSAHWKGLRASTQKTYRGIIERFRVEHGDKRVSMLRPEHVRRIVAAKADTPAAANNLLRVLHLMMQFAIDDGWRQDDPTRDVRKVRHKPKGFRTWTEEDIAAFRARHPMGSRARLALELLLYTGARRSDVVNLGRQHVEGAIIKIRQQKTDAVVEILILPPLAEAIETVPKDQLTFLLTAKGKPFTPGGFYNWFSACAREAGISDGPGPHGLRKAIARRLAEARATSQEIMAVTGHTTLKEVERYTKEANKAELAASGLSRLRDRK